jgi:hypothetical protein
LNSFVWQWSKIAAQKKVSFFADFALVFYGIGATIRIGQEMLCLPYADFFLLLFKLNFYQEQKITSQFLLNKSRQDQELFSALSMDCVSPAGPTPCSC